jgi:nucleoside-diphosphate-sugar epimerase
MRVRSRVVKSGASAMVDKVVITGAAGRVGSTMAPLFKKDGWEVVGIDWRIGTYVTVLDELTNALSTMPLLENAVVLHFAGTADPDCSWEAAIGNVQLTLMVLKHSSLAKRVLVASSPWVFRAPDLPYGASKVMIEAIAKDYGALIHRIGWLPPEGTPRNKDEWIESNRTTPIQLYASILLTLSLAEGQRE